MTYDKFFLRFINYDSNEMFQLKCSLSNPVVLLDPFVLLEIPKIENFLCDKHKQILSQDGLTKLLNGRHYTYSSTDLHRCVHVRPDEDVKPCTVSANHFL